MLFRQKCNFFLFTYNPQEYLFTLFDHNLTVLEYIVRYRAGNIRDLLAVDCNAALLHKSARLAL